jgi:hypothetical protein
MLYVQPDLYARSETRRRQEATDQAETWRVLHRANWKRRGWFLRQNRLMLCRLGRGLVSVGLWMESQGSLEESSTDGAYTALA